MNAHGFVPFLLDDVSARVYGGRCKDYDKEERRLVGVKMAVEINKFHHISVPTEDFSIPSVEDMQLGLMEAYDYMAKGNDLYVGCMGGIGRTGLFMGCIAKLMQDCGNVGFQKSLNTGDPVLWVRENYIPHAIETKQQQDFVRNFDTYPVIEHIRIRMREREVPVEVVREVQVPVFPPIWEYMAWWLTGGFMR